MRNELIEYFIEYCADIHKFFGAFFSPHLYVKQSVSFSDTVQLALSMLITRMNTSHHNQKDCIDDHQNRFCKVQEEVEVHLKNCVHNKCKLRGKKWQQGIFPDAVNECQPDLVFGRGAFHLQISILKDSQNS